MKQIVENQLDENLIKDDQVQEAELDALFGADGDCCGNICLCNNLECVCKEKTGLSGLSDEDESDNVVF